MKIPGSTLTSSSQWALIITRLTIASVRVQFISIKLDQDQPRQTHLLCWSHDSLTMSISLLTIGSLSKITQFMTGLLARPDVLRDCAFTLMVTNDLDRMSNG